MQPETQLSGVLMVLLLWRPWHFCFDAFPLCASPNLLKHFGTIDSMAIGVHSIRAKMLSTSVHQSHRGGAHSGIIILSGTRVRQYCLGNTPWHVAR